MSSADPTAPRTINAYAGLEKDQGLQPWQYQSRPLGAGDVEIKISHCGICSSDLHMLDGGWGPAPFPCVAGHEIIGEVTVVGSEVKHLVVGDRVGVGGQAWACLNKDKERPCAECADGADAYCSRSVWTITLNYEDGSPSYGGYADYIRVLADYAFKIPDKIPSDVAAPLLCAGATVFTPLKTYNVKPGDRVGVIGIGGLGHIAIQFIRALGATPIAFSRSANKEKEIRGLGAEEFYNLSDPEQAQKAASSVNVLLITADATNMPYNTYLQLVRSRGTVVMLGIPNDSVTFAPFFLVPRGVRFVGSAIGSIQDIKDMLKVASEKNVRPIIQKVPMAKVNEGLQMVRDGSVRYRVVLEN
ncbi:Mannitol dehydrogenase, partial [Globisporangium splendens]